MERKEQLCSAIKKIFWGYILLYFNINLGTIDILPGWLGYIFFYQAINNGIDMEEESVKLLKPICTILAVYNFITWFLNMFAISTDIYIVNEVVAVIALYFHFQLLTNLANIAHKYGCEQKQSLLHLRTVHTILMTILAFTVHFEEIYWLSLCIVVVQVVIMICICFVLSKFKYTIEDLPENVFHEINVEIYYN